MNISGYCHPDFAEVRGLFESLWQGIEIGAATSAYVEGECIFDLWGGFTDRAQTQTWQQNTLVNTYSISKGVVATAIAKLVEAGALAYEHKVCDYWPEFSQQGKDQITIEQLLSHQAGLCGIDTRIEVEDLYDWEKMTDLLAAQAPLWPPGSAAGYHPITWGFLAGELIRRATGQMPGDFIQEQICEPMGLNFHLGVPDAELVNCAELIGPNHIPDHANPRQDATGQEVEASAVAKEQTHLYQLAQLNPVISPFKHASSKAWRQAQIPASNGHSDARSLAKLYGTLANGGKIEHHSLLDPNTLFNASTAVVENQTDLIMNQVINRSRGGYILSHDNNYGPTHTGFGHAGAGGSMAFGDPTARVGFSYIMNQLQPEGYGPRYGRIVDKIYHFL